MDPITEPGTAKLRIDSEQPPREGAILGGLGDLSQYQGTAIATRPVSGTGRFAQLTDARLIILVLLGLAAISLIRESPLIGNIASGLLGFLSKGHMDNRT